MLHVNVLWGNGLRGFATFATVKVRKNIINNIYIGNRGNESLRVTLSKVFTFFTVVLL